MPSCASLLVPAGSGLCLAHGCFLLITRLESHTPVVDRPAGLVRENEERLRELLWNSQILKTRLESYAPVVHRPAGLVRIQKMLPNANNLKEIGKQFDKG